MCWKWLSYIANTSEPIHMRSWSGSLTKAEFTFHCFKYPPQYVSLHIVMFQPSVWLTVVCYCYYIRIVCNPDISFIIVLSQVFQMLYMSSVRTVDSVNISCAYCDRYFCDWTAIWQESHWVSNNCTVVVLQADASDNQQNNLKYFNCTDVDYSKELNLHINF